MLELIVAAGIALALLVVVTAFALSIVFRRNVGPSQAPLDSEERHWLKVNEATQRAHARAQQEEALAHAIMTSIKDIDSFIERTGFASWVGKRKPHGWLVVAKGAGGEHASIRRSMEMSLRHLCGHDRNEESTRLDHYLDTIGVEGMEITRQGRSWLIALNTKRHRAAFSDSSPSRALSLCLSLLSSTRGESAGR